MQCFINFCMCYLLSHVQLFASPWTVALGAPRFMEFSRQEYWSGLPCPSPEGSNPGFLHCMQILYYLSYPGSTVKPVSPTSPALQADSLPAEPLGNPPITASS